MAFLFSQHHNLPPTVTKTIGEIYMPVCRWSAKHPTAGVLNHLCFCGVSDIELFFFVSETQIGHE